ncbi:MAG: hypothetical protein ACD_50C00078G0002 [uncultured bacterium]|nr:MAG: hypothetical protein ACD_50C00078G0002 [uncultured bacterium]OGH14614.1 MAG: hypothetical protein A2687_03630 [Candidatus Levybacteria bacterium RIFCSPHIGHO2_01_FULL_38_26]
MAKDAQKIRATTQKFTEIEDVTGNIVLLSSGNACLIIEVKATNFALLSKEEQDAKIFAYAALLNSLSFPIQIFIRSKRIDISSYLKLLDQEAKNTQNDVLRNRIVLYRDFVQDLIRINTVLDKRFYIVIPYSYLESGAAGAKTFAQKTRLDKDAAAEAAKLGLDLKAKSLHAQLKRLGLVAKTLEKEELIRLFYEIYNEDFVETNPITDNVKAIIIKSGGKA